MRTKVVSEQACDLALRIPNALESKHLLLQFLLETSKLFDDHVHVVRICLFADLLCSNVQIDALFFQLRSLGGFVALDNVDETEYGFRNL